MMKVIYIAVRAFESWCGGQLASGQAVVSDVREKLW